MNSPLICIRHWDRGFVEGLIAKSKERHLSLMENKSLSLEANIIKNISSIYDKKKDNPFLKDIAENLSDEENRKYSSRLIGTIVRDNLGMVTGHSREGNIVIVEKGKLDRLLEEYNLQI
jgi:hypothetical protein